MSTTIHAPDVDAAVIGAGFGGMYAVHKLRELHFSVRGFEAGSDVGGTWFWNRYPGARCDVESLSYSYTFDPELVKEWRWSERYATQPEILRYAQWVADKLDLRPLFSFDTRIRSARFEEASSVWEIITDAGEVTRARFLITAVGCLSAASVPHFDGLESFDGPVYHTGQWPTEGVDFTGQRVAVIGTGSSGIQLIPQVAAQADHLTVFQRTPNYSLPARNRPLYEDELQHVRKNHAQIRERARRCPAGNGWSYGRESAIDIDSPTRADIFDLYWKAGGNHFVTAFTDVMVDLEANGTASQYIRDRIATTVDDPETARKLTPTDYPFGAKRVCVDTDYYATFNRSNVALVDVRDEPIESFEPTGLRTATESYEFDAVVMATGYDSMTGSLTRIDIRGRDGLTLKDAWATGPHTFLGLATHGFPNMFMITGPGSPSVLANVIACIEQHVEWIADFLVYLRTNSLSLVEADLPDQESWVAHVNEIAAQTLYMHGKSWYLGDNIEGKPRVFMPYPGGLDVYRDRCDAIAAAGYAGFTTAADAGVAADVATSSN